MSDRPLPAVECRSMSMVAKCRRAATGPPPGTRAEPSIVYMAMGWAPPILRHRVPDWWCVEHQSTDEEGFSDEDYTRWGGLGEARFSASRRRSIRVGNRPCISSVEIQRPWRIAQRLIIFHFTCGRRSRCLSRLPTISATHRALGTRSLPTASGYSTFGGASVAQRSTVAPSTCTFSHVRGM